MLNRLNAAFATVAFTVSPFSASYALDLETAKGPYLEFRVQAPKHTIAWFKTCYEERYDQKYSNKQKCLLENEGQANALKTQCTKLSLLDPKTVLEWTIAFSCKIEPASFEQAAIVYFLTQTHGPLKSDELVLRSTIAIACKC